MANFRAAHDSVRLDQHSRTFSDFGAFIVSSLTHTFLDKWLPITLEYVMFASATQHRDIIPFSHQCSLL